jgi:hypothetical protein
MKAFVAAWTLMERERATRRLTADTQYRWWRARYNTCLRRAHRRNAAIAQANMIGWASACHDASPAPEAIAYRYQCSLRGACLYPAMCSIVRTCVERRVYAPLAEGESNAAEG